MIPMKLPGYYSSGEFARMANVSIRTIRFYDKQNILKPSYVNPSGARFYTDSDLARLQQILLLKYLGFSLDDIKEMTLEIRTITTCSIPLSCSRNSSLTGWNSCSWWGTPLRIQ